MYMAGMLLIDHKEQMRQIFDSGYAYLCFLNAVTYQKSSDKFETFLMCRRWI
jgi:hypothetical protein